MRYICQICGYVYDDAKEKIPFSDLPDNWKCPLCGAAKSDFRQENSQREVPEAPVRIPDADMKELSAGQLAALCSNLARGCEKQYKEEEAGLFRKLADYFTSAAPKAEDATVEKLAASLQDDIAQYGSIRAAADEASDRGAARICVWGEKVTRMLFSLVSRYLEEGEAMLADAKIWICTTCGFVYIGDEAPEICPVCKVPAWKFDMIEGRAGQ